LPATKGTGIFIVEKGTPGLSIGKHENKLGIRASSTVEVILEDVRVPAENILVREGMGFPILMKTLDLTRIPVAVQAVGIAQGALDYAIQYTKERVQFGKPIFSFQGLQWMMADMTTQVEAARQLAYKAASLFEDLPKNLDKLPKETVRYSAMAKLFAAETAMKVTTDAVQLLGGYGYIKEYPVERMMRDAKITQIYEGTSQIQKVVIASTL
jgi:alkylation response protein AidB-like acyl-CoA dehydrogenase